MYGTTKIVDGVINSLKSNQYYIKEILCPKCGKPAQWIPIKLNEKQIINTLDWNYKYYNSKIIKFISSEN